MKSLLSSVSIVAIAATAWAATPSVGNVALNQDAATGEIVVSYDLAKADAIITLDLIADGTALLTGDERERLTGDVAKLVSTGNGREIRWKPLRFSGPVSSVSARVVAWEAANPPDYLVIDMTMKEHRWYYERESDLPYGGVTNILYKTDRLVMRKIPAKDVVWRMGQPYPDGEPCDDEKDMKVSSSVLDDETGHMVKLTEDYYIGIYEMTRRQYQRVVNADAVHADTKVYPTDGEMVDNWTAPAHNVTYETLRGEQTASFKSWPESGHTVGSSSKIKTFRDFAGLDGIDLPTEAQWEFACRAGTGTSLNSGKPLKTTKNWADANAAEVAWYGNTYGNAGGACCHPVGLRQANAFGLYDMHGNVLELCLDRFASGDAYRATFAAGWQEGAVTADPTGPSDASLTESVGRGGGFFYASTVARSASRVKHIGRSSSNKHYGFRLVCTLPVK